MKLLRETIQKILLQEYACEGINKTLWSGILEMDRLGLTMKSSWSPEEYDSGAANSIDVGVYDDLGRQVAYWMGTSKYGGDECLDAFQCTGTDAQDLEGTGVGALLYDVACELVGERGLSADRNEVSDSAWKMWKYMTLNDQTYDIKGTYDYDGEQTPDDPSDDCYGDSWKEHTEDWLNPNNHPLNHVFVKKDKSRPTIACLEERGMIEYDED